MTHAYAGGPNIVAIGGGTGLSTLLRGLKRYSRNLTAIVTMADDGGGSGRLRRDLGIPPPGDVRNCLQALANAEPVMEELIDYRFTEGTLAGQSFGNLFLAALNGISGSFYEAVARMSQVLAITGRVLPVTADNIRLVAEFENDTRIVGECRIRDFKKAQDCRIRRVWLEPEHPTANPEALDAIRRADVIVMGPGSLYTSIIPNLLVDGVAQAVAESAAMRIYICNIMTEDGETEGYTVGDHLKAILAHSGRPLVDLCLANVGAIPAEKLDAYRQEDAQPIQVDAAAVAELGVELVTGDFTDQTLRQLARHDPDKLARAVLELTQARSMRVLDAGVTRYTREH